MLLETLGSIIFEILKWVMPNGIIRIWHYYKIDRHFRKFFKKNKTEETVLIVPPSDMDQIIKGTQVCDFLGAMEIQDIFSEFGYKLKKVRANKISEEEIKHNLISVSGPIPNVVTKFMLELNEIHYKFGGSDGHSIINNINPSHELFPQLNEKGNVTYDFGIITRMKNPYEPNKDAIIVCGRFGWGTQAALRILMDKESLIYLNKFGKYFQVICTCGVDGDCVILKSYLIDLHPDESIRQKTIVDLYTRQANKHEKLKDKIGIFIKNLSNTGGK